jgi:hypothetical protein
MRWDRLFGDLEAQFDAADGDALAAEIADRSRREVAAVTLLDRLRPAVGTALELIVEGAGVLHGTLARVGPGWLLLDVEGQAEALVTAHALLGVRGLPLAADSPGAAGAVAARLDLGYVLRIVARDRSPVGIVARDGMRLDGTIDRVGADFVDLAEHASGEPRRPGQVSGVRTVAFSAIAVVRAR